RRVQPTLGDPSARLAHRYRDRRAVPLSARERLDDVDRERRRGDMNHTAVAVQRAPLPGRGNDGDGRRRNGEGDRGLAGRVGQRPVIAQLRLWRRPQEGDPPGRRFEYQRLHRAEIGTRAGEGRAAEEGGERLQRVVGGLGRAVRGDETERVLLVVRGRRSVSVAVPGDEARALSPERGEGAGAVRGLLLARD